MTRHAKASSAGSNSGLRAKTPALLFLIALLTLVVGVSVAIAAKKVDSFAGSPTGATGNTAGLLNTPRGIAVNQAGTGGAVAGDFYVVDGSNNRIVQYRANNTFVRAFGQDVVSSGPDQAIEVQRVTVNAGEGTFKLTFGANTTADLPYNATAGEVQTALNALASVNSGGGSVTVSGGPGDGTGSTPYFVSFSGVPLKGTNVAQMTGASGATPLGGGTGTGANAATVLTANSGATGYEVCDVLVNPTDVCKAGTTGGLGGAMSAPQGVAIEQSTGNLFVTDQSNRRVQKFSATGAWLLAFGSDVVQAGGSGDNPTAPLLNEKQTVQLRDLFGLFPPPTTGTFTLTFEGQTTTPIAAQATPAAVDAALEALSTVGAGGVSVSGPNGPNWSVEFTGPLGAINVPPLTGDPLLGNPAGLAGTSPEVVVSTNQSGGPGAPVLGEVCSLMWQCKAAGPAAAEAGAFGTSLGHPALDSSGNVYVPDSSNSRVQKFTSAGAFLTAWGWDVIPAGRPGDTGTGLESCPAAAASTIGNCQAGAAGEGLGQFDSARPSRMAVDSTGRVFALSNGRGVQTFDSSGGSPANFAAADLSGSLDVTNIAIGAGDRVFVTQTCNATLCPDAAVANEQRIREFSSAGVLQDTHMVGAGFTTVNGLAVNSTSGNLLVSTSGGTPGSRVWTLDDDGTQPASVATINPPTEVTEHTASLNGSVTPNGPASFTTSYRFEYSRNGVTWTPVAAEVNLGEGVSPVSVPTAPAQGAVTGLEANTFYRARIVAKKAFGAGTTISPEVTFLTDGVRPEVATYHPQSHTDTSANLLGQLNPNNLPTTYHFEYGKTTAYGNSAPVPGAGANGGVANLVSQQVEGLEPGTTYHYRLVATNSEGTTNGNDVTFKTYPADSVGLAQRAYEMMTPPFKTVRSPVAFGGAVGNNANPGVPSLSGDAMLWTTAIFPLTEDVRGPGGGDVRYLERGAGGWTFTTQNTLTMKAHTADEVQLGGLPFSRYSPRATSGDLRTSSVQMVNGELIASDGYDANPFYTFRAGTGVEGGYTPWLSNTDTQLNSGGVTGNGEWGTLEDFALLNDDGTALLHWGSYRGLAEDPNTPGDDDPTDEQLRSVSGGAPARSVYLQRTADPDALPAASKDLVNECTGTGAGATEIPNRVGTGSASTDTVGTQTCEPATATPAASGTAVRSTGSATLTGVTTATGAFSVGQFVSGTGIPYGATITAVGAGTLTLSTPVVCGGAKGNGASLTFGSPEVTRVRPMCGKFEVGQTVTGAGIPGATTILDVDKYTLTLSANATASGSGQNIVSDTPSTTAIVANPQHVTSRSGAKAGGFPAIGALAADGNRVFFASPDFADETGGEGGAGPAPGCSNGTGVSTSCSPQLFVRQYDSAGNPTVRWISRAQGVGAQRVAEMGRGALFQGASRDGRYVYFHTNAPLLPNDPNAGVSITTGSAQDNSWDLYRYTLPASRDVDPGGGTLLRVSGGPTGTADPDVTNVPKVASLRYFSDDGKRAYFLTTATIPGAINNPPGGGSTAPSGAVGNNATRNLYLFDDTGASPQWRFIAQLPYSISISNESKEALNTCATARSFLAGGHISSTAGNSRSQGQSNCFRGTRDGSGVVFFTRGQLTNDDRDDAGDIYLYDAEADELTRVSAPRNNTTPYVCNRGQSVAGVETGVCNADMGMNQSGGGSFAVPAGALDYSRGWGGGRLYNLAKDANGKISVYFESQSQLIPQDTNGTRMDVYEWRAGKLSLVSPGNTDSHSFYSGNSIDGRDVFLFTSARIDPREIDDDDFDLYDVRRGGGYPYTPPATPCEVLAHECRQAVPAPPAAPAPASQGLNGQGNQPKQPKQSCAKGKKLRQGKCVVKKSKAHKKHRKGATQRGSK